MEGLTESRIGSSRRERLISALIAKKRERIASFLEADAPIAATRHGETVGVYIPTRRKRPKIVERAELKAAADRLAKSLAD